MSEPNDHEKDMIYTEKGLPDHHHHHHHHDNHQHQHQHQQPHEKNNHDNDNETISLTKSASFPTGINQRPASPPPYFGHNTPCERRLLLKQDLRILPLSAGIYLLCYLDRSNIGNAKLLNQDSDDDLLSDTSMTNHQYTIALMAFLIAYALFEVPSNYMLKRMRPSRWIAVLMLSWGAMTMGLGGTKNFAGVTAVRFFLGVFEAGLFPGEF